VRFCDANRPRVRQSKRVTDEVEPRTCVPGCTRATAKSDPRTFLLHATVAQAAPPPTRTSIQNFTFQSPRAGCASTRAESGPVLTQRNAQQTRGDRVAVRACRCFPADARRSPVFEPWTKTPPGWQNWCVAVVRVERHSAHVGTALPVSSKLFRSR
jgi:hypothetical protein